MVLNIASEIVMFDPQIDFGKAQDMAEAILARVEKDDMLHCPVYGFVRVPNGWEEG